MTDGKVTLKTTVTRTQYERADRLCKQQGTTLAAVMRSALLSLGEPDARSSSGPVTDSEWSAVNQWMRETGTYPTNRPEDQRALLTWARESGFDG